MQIEPAWQAHEPIVSANQCLNRTSDSKRPRLERDKTTARPQVYPGEEEHHVYSLPALNYHVRVPRFRKAYKSH